MNHPGDFEPMFVFENQRRQQQDAERERLANLARQNEHRTPSWPVRLWGNISGWLLPPSAPMKEKASLRRRKGW